MKTSELTGAALDWAVAKSLNWAVMECEEVPGKIPQTAFLIYLDSSGPIGPNGRMYSPSTNWERGGPIIEREEIGLKRNAPCSTGREWEASPSITAKGAGGKWGYGPTPLIAAMRAYVASKLGNEVEIPEELE